MGSLFSWSTSIEAALWNKEEALEKGSGVAGNILAELSSMAKALTAPKSF